MISTPPQQRLEVINSGSPGTWEAPQPRSGLCVASIIDTSIVSGPARQLVQLALALRSHDVRLHVILFGGPHRAPSALLPVLEAAGIEHTVVEEKRRSDFSVVSRLGLTLKRIGAHLVQTHSYRPAMLMYLLRRAGDRTPWVAFSHGVTREYKRVLLYNMLDRWVCRRADRIVVMSQTHAGGWSDVADKVRVIYNAALDVKEPGELPPALAAWVRALPRPRLGVIGRLSPEKGVDIFIEAVKILRNRGISVTGVIAGDGPERRALEAQVARAGLTESIAMLGNVHPITPLYRELEAVVIPSRSEGLPNVMLEACRMDTPFLATRVGGIPEIVEPNEAGVLVKPEDPRGLATGIAALVSGLDDPTAREGRRRLTAQVSLDQRVDAHLSLYRDLL